MGETTAPDFDLVRTRLEQVRTHQKMSLRAVSEAADVSAATLSRFESRKGNLDLATLSKLISWLGIDQSQVFGGSADAEQEGLDTPGLVEVHLRADRKLDPQTATALAEGFRALYEQFAQDESDQPVRKGTSPS